MTDPSPELALVPTESERQGAGGAAATASPAACDCMSEKYKLEEFEAFIGAVWNFAPDPDAEDDLTRFDELLHAALVYIGRVALDPSTDPFDADRAARLLRSMELRALWGPDHPVIQP